MVFGIPALWGDALRVVGGALVALSRHPFYRSFLMGFVDYVYYVYYMYYMYYTGHDWDDQGDSGRGRARAGELGGVRFHPSPGITTRGGCSAFPIFVNVDGMYIPFVFFSVD